jgi:spore maturation protein CgeB
MGYEVTTYDFKQTKYNNDREKINLKLLTLVRNYIPDLVIFFPQTNELIPEIVDDINKHTKTLGYFYDDIWRVKFSNFWAI